MTVLFVFKIRLLNEHFALGHHCVLLAPGCLLASGEGVFSANLQTVDSREQKYFFLAFEDLPEESKVLKS